MAGRCCNSSKLLMIQHGLLTSMSKAKHLQCFALPDLFSSFGICNNQGRVLFMHSLWTETSTNVSLQRKLQNTQITSSSQGSESEHFCGTKLLIGENQSIKWVCHNPYVTSWIFPHRFEYIYMKKLTEMKAASDWIFPVTLHE